MLKKVYTHVFTFCAIAVAFTASSCKKEYVKKELDPSTITNMEELQVNSNFDWTSASQFTIQVNLVDNSDGKVQTDGLLIQLLDQDFNRIKMGKIQNNLVIIDTRIPVSVTRLYLHIPVTGNIAEIGSLTSPQIINMSVFATGTTGSKTAERSAAPEDCASGCSRTLSGTTSNELVIAINETVCLTGTHNGKVRFNGAGTLRVCGTLNSDDINFDGNGLARVVISETGKLNTKNFNLNNNKQELHNYGTLTVDGNFSPNSNVTNYNKITITGDLNINGQSTFINRGTLDAKKLSNNYYFYNYGFTTISDDLNNNGNKTLENHGSLVVRKHFAQNSNLINKAYISVGEEFKGNNGNVTFGSQSMISARDFTFNGIKITAEGEGAVIKISKKTTINSGGTVNGKLDICTSDGGDFKNNNNQLGPNVYFCNSDIYIPVTQFNPVGYGVEQVKDADKDGIPDNIDQYPNDSTKAFLVSDPYIGYKTSMFEDLWPTRGDYDFNDVVVKNKTHYILSPKAQIVSAEMEYVLSAMGGSIPKGLAYQFLTLDVSGGKPVYSKYNLTGKVKDITVSKGNISPVFETGTGNTIRTCSNLFQTQSTQYSNDSLNNSAKPDTFRFNVSFNAGLEYSLLLVTDIFIFKTEDRAQEIHIAGRPATSLASTSMFGTAEDRTNPAENNWYKTEKNLPWGIEVYSGTFEFAHPSKKNSILLAYPNFASWAQSGGTSTTDWYQKPNTNYTFKF
jgi:LruC domain-containing protein